MTTLSKVSEQRKANRSRGKYRENVAALIVNARGRILILKRAKTMHHWQLPQGGVDQGESRRQAVRREILEETGLTRLKQLSVVPDFYSYEWPRVQKYADAQYVGQRQSLYIYRHLGRDSDVRIDHHEADEYQWVHPRDFVKSIARVRRAMSEKVMDAYRTILKK